MSDGRLSNVEAEAALLGALMMPGNGALIDGALDTLTPHAFSEPFHGRLFDVIGSQHSLGKQASPPFLKGFVEGDPTLERLGGIGYLARLTSNGEGLLAPRELAQQILELHHRRSLREALTQVAKSCEDHGMSIAELTSEADAALTMKVEDDVRQIGGFDSICRMIDGFGKDQPGATCGQIAIVDELLGPMRPGQFIIGAGRPGMGKTAFAISYAVGAAMRGHGVLYVSLEMSHKELSQRMACDLAFQNGAGVPFAYVRDDNPKQDAIDMLKEAILPFAGKPFEIVDAGSLTASRLARLVRSHVRKFEARGHKLEVVIVDYLQLLSTDVRHRSSYETISEISRSLKQIAKDQSVAMFALAQLSRAVESRPDRRPQLSDLRDSGQIEQDADAVLFLSRQEYYHRLAEPEEGTPEWTTWQAELAPMLGEIEFICAKRRNGRTGNGKGKFFGVYQAVRS